MWVFLLSILGLTMFFLMGDLVNQHIPGLSWLFPTKAAAPAAVPSLWRLELAPADGKGRGDYRLTLPASRSSARNQPEIVLTCAGGRFFAHINPDAATPFSIKEGTAVTELTFDKRLKRSWEQGQGGLLFAPNATWFVEKALAPRKQLTVSYSVVDAPDPVTADFVLAGLGMYSALLGKCGVSVPLEAVESGVPTPGTGAPVGSPGPAAT